MKYAFRDDYSEGCHPTILQALSESNMEQCAPYGNDIYSEQARALMRAQMGTEDTAIYFVNGGTQANLIINAVCLKSHEAVIAPISGHISTNETGAIEATGHKVLTADTHNGKLTAETLQYLLDQHNHFPHVTKPKLVYISNATEIGTVYTKGDIAALSANCKQNGLYLMVDGARLALALASDDSDLALADLAEYCDIFWFGGTKNGALFGEAIIIPNQELAQEFEFHLKQRGALLAKGRGLGIQFKALFSNNLHSELASHANRLAKKLAASLQDAGYEMVSQPQANMIFPVLPNEIIQQLQQEFDFYIWKKVDDENSVVRLITSWATDETQVDRFTAALSTIKN